MKKLHIYLNCLLVIGVIAFGWYAFSHNNAANSSNNQPIRSLTDQIIIGSNKQVNVSATTLPEFVYNLDDNKFSEIVNATGDNIKNLVKAKIAYADSSTSINTKVTIEKDKKQLMAKPEDIPNFRPGLYKLSLTMRTLDGDVNIEQDFTWGVIAVNTNKSIFQPGEKANIGIGVLDDHGETLCKSGLKRVDDLSMSITDPQGIKTDFSIKDNTIKDSGNCGANTVTNDADFQAHYPTTTDGTYQMTVTAVVNGQERHIEDYFKVDSTAAFDIERTSFPTRIYPFAIYPVTFTVTPNQDYQGEISDTVPSFFAINQVSNMGRTVKQGDFTKITWNVKLKKGEAQTFSYFIKFPPISPEFYLLGPIQIGNFKEARQWQVASDAINSSSGVFTAEDNGSSNTWYRTWTGTAWNPLPPTAPTTMSNTPADSRWFKEVSNPITGEKITLVLDNNNSTGATANVLYVFRWTGTQWGAVAGTADITMTMTTNNIAKTRYMDVAYSQVSGNAILVYADPESATTPNQMRYITRVNNVWSSSGTISPTAGTLFSTATSPKSWIRLVSKTGSDSILLSYVNTSNRVGAMVWDGDSWGNELIDDATNSPTPTAVNIQESVSSGWETNSVIPMVAWGNSGTSITYRRLVSNAWTTESTTGLTGLNTSAYWVNMASDDSSDDLALGFSTSGATPNCYFAIWNGSSWTMDPSGGIGCRSNVADATNDGTIDNRPINVAWEHGTGQAVWVYNTSAAPTFLNYKLWNGSFGASTSMGGTAQTNPMSIQMYSDPYSVSIIMLYSMGTTTGTAAVYDREWNGSSWTGTPTDPLFGNVNNDTEHAEAFGYGFDLNLETTAAYRWFANSPGTNASVDTTLTAQDTIATLTSANQQFRLRILVYYPDSLSSGARSYNLQYVDPGSGTCSNPSGGTPPNWTPVPNVNDTSTTIAFYNNTSVASASAATANGSLDPTYASSTKVAETYNEQNTFTTNAAVSGTNVGLFDFSLVDKTTFDRIAQTYCFRVTRSNNNLPLQVLKYPQIITAAINDVLIQGRSTIQGGTTIK